jgi:hypothetical protein
VNPITDASALAHMFDTKNLFPVLIVLSLFVGFIVAWIGSLIVDRRNRKGIQALREAHFVLYGEIKSGQGKDIVRCTMLLSYRAVI